MPGPRPCWVPDEDITTQYIGPRYTDQSPMDPNHNARRANDCRVYPQPKEDVRSSLRKKYPHGSVVNRLCHAGVTQQLQNNDGLPPFAAVNDEDRRLRQNT